MADFISETSTVDEDWRAPEGGDDTSYQIDEYDLTSSPNDFNVLTIFNFIESGSVKIPAFQRNYVWDIKQASRLIESLIIGLPVPQVFLYERGRNSFLVVDGQQRLMTIFYFIKMRFPRRDRRAELRRVFDQQRTIPDDVLYDEEYFESFKLRLPEIADDRPNKFTGLNYKTLGEYQTQFDLRTIRNIIVKQVKPSNDDSSMFELFNRLNTGGTSLLGQEIRASLYHSKFLDLLASLNMDPRWRRLIGQPEPDLHMRDLEVLLRATAMWKSGGEYKAPMYKFLNRFAQQATGYTKEQLDSFRISYDWFLDAASNLSSEQFSAARAKFTVALFEAAFAALLERHSQEGAFIIPPNFVNNLRDDSGFQHHAQYRPTDRQNVRGRLERAHEILSELCLEG